MYKYPYLSQPNVKLHWWKQKVNDAYYQGVCEGEAHERNKQDSEIKALRIKVESIRTEALRQICQSGATVIESMSKALLSYDKNL